MQNQPPARRPGELAFNVILLCFSLYMGWQAYQISGFSALSSAGAFPMAMTAIMAAASGITLWHSARLAPAVGGFSAFRKEVLPPAILVFALFILGYSLVLKSLGFVLASFMFLLVSFWFLERGRFKRAVVLAIVSIIGVYIVFRLVFQVVLPEGVIPERSIMAAIGSMLSGGN